MVDEQHQLATYSQLLSSLAWGSTLEDVAQIAARLARELLKADGASVTREEGAHLLYIAAQGSVSSLLGERTPKLHGFTGRVVRERRAAIFDPERASAESRVRAVKTGVASGIVAPIIVADDVRGTIGVVSHEAGRFGNPQLAVLESLAQFIAIGLAMRDQQIEAETSRRAAESASRNNNELLARIASELRTRVSRTPEIYPERAELLEIAGDIDSYARLESGELTVDLRDTDVRELVASIAESLGDRAARASVELDTSVGESVPASVWTDAARIRRVIARLTASALEQQPGRVAIEVSRNPVDAPAILVRICTVCQPWSTERRRRAFDVVHAESWSLHLATAKRIVEELGGAIGIDATSTGNQIWFTIPL